LEITHPGRRPPNHASPLCTKALAHRTSTTLLSSTKASRKSHTLHLLLCVSVGLTYNSGNDPIILRGLCDQAGLPTCTMTPCRSADPTPPHPAIVHHIPEHAVLTRGEVQHHNTVLQCAAMENQTGSQLTDVSVMWTGFLDL